MIPQSANSLSELLLQLLAAPDLSRCDVKGATQGVAPFYFHIYRCLSSQYENELTCTYQLIISIFTAIFRLFSSQ